MQLYKYINHKTQRSLQSQQTSNKKSNMFNNNTKPKVIKFVGNMDQNVKEILQGIQCHCGNKKQFYNIMIVFANKIQKLRKQRQHYKNTLKQYLITMNNQNIKNSANKLQKKSVQIQTIPIKKQSILDHEALNEIRLTPNKKQNKEQYSNNTKSIKKNILHNASKQSYQKQFNCFDKQRIINTTYKNKQNQQIRNNYTAIKKQSLLNFYGNEDASALKMEIKEIKSQDKRKKMFYEDDLMVDGDDQQGKCYQKVNSFQKNDKENSVQKSYSKYHSKKRINLVGLNDSNKNQGNINHDLEEFSLNLSSFQDCEKTGNDGRQCSQFMKEISGIMSQTNLLESDQEKQFKQSNNCQLIKTKQIQQSLIQGSRKSSASKSNKSKKSRSVYQKQYQNKGISQLEQKINKLKMMKQSTNLVHFGSTIGRQFNESILSDKLKVSKNFQQQIDDQRNYNLGNASAYKNKERLEDQQMPKMKSLTAIKSKVAKISNQTFNQRQKQNIYTGKPCIKFSQKRQPLQPNQHLSALNITLQKLQQFIDKKQLKRQLQYTQKDLEMSLKQFKTFNSCTLKPSQYKDILGIKSNQNKRSKSPKNSIFEYVLFKEPCSTKKSIKVLGQKNMNY